MKSKKKVSLLTSAVGGDGDGINQRTSFQMISTGVVAEGRRGNRMEGGFVVSAKEEAH